MQAVRNEQDLECMAVPQKYKALNNFYKYRLSAMMMPDMMRADTIQGSSKPLYLPCLWAGITKPRITFINCVLPNSCIDCIRLISY